MELTSSDQRKLANDQQRKEMEHLLERYPDIRGEEEAEILRFLKKGPPVEVALLTTNDVVKPKLERFRADHAREFSIGPKDLLVVALVVMAIVVLSVLLWDVGAGP